MQTNDIITAVKTLNEGGIVAHATETCYGLACDLSNPDAVAKLFALKQRPEHMPVSVLFASVDQAKEYVQWNDAAQKLADEHLPGPLTMILNATNKDLFVVPNDKDPNSKPTTQNSELRTIGVRISSNSIAQELVKSFGSPISTTSANIHGQPNAYSIDQLRQEGIEPDFIIDSGELPEVAASKVIDLSEGKEEVLRK